MTIKQSINKGREFIGTPIAGRWLFNGMIPCPDIPGMWDVMIFDIIASDDQDAFFAWVTEGYGEVSGFLAGHFPEDSASTWRFPTAGRITPAGVSDADFADQIPFTRTPIPGPLTTNELLPSDLSLFDTPTPDPETD